MPLTDAACKNAKPTEKPYKLADGGGLHLLVKASGSKLWRMKYRHAGKEKLLSFGIYPDVSLSEAREKRSQARKLIDLEADPSQAKRLARQQKALNHANTFEAVAREWHTLNLARLTERHGKNVLHRLSEDVFPLLGSRPIADIEAPELLDMLRQVEKRGALEIAKRLGQTCGQVFRYAIATSRAKRNPVPDLRDALKPVIAGQHAALDSKDIPEFIRALDLNERRLFPLTRLAIRLMLLTFVRTGELIGARWSEFDLDNGMWVIPAERMKMRNEHYVPLATQTVALLREVQTYSGGRDMVFPNQANPGSHMSNNTILYALGRLGYKGRMTGHGFRALAMSTIKEKLGYRHEVIDRQLAHAHKNKVDRAYDRAKFLEERIVMMQHWADYLDALMESNVIAANFKR